MQKNALTRLLTLATLTSCFAACGDAPTLEADPVFRADDEEITELQAYYWANIGPATARSSGISEARGYLSVEFQTRVATILEHAVNKQLIEEPNCGGLEMRERVPTDLVNRIHIKPDRLEVEMIPDCETVPPVPEDFDGVTDDLWNEEYTDYATFCGTSDEDSGESGEGHTMVCARVEEYDRGRTVSYPEVEDYEIPEWFAQGETDCESDAICRIVDLELWPTSPAPGEGEIFEISCEDHPELCELRVDLIDPLVLESGEELTVHDTNDEECVGIIDHYNSPEGGQCTAHVAECALGGACTSETDTGYIACAPGQTTGDTTCSQCVEVNADGSCKTANVSTERSDNGDEPNPLYDTEDASRGFRAAEAARGHDPGEVGGNYDSDSRTYNPTDGAKCNAVGHRRHGEDWVLRFECT